MTTQVLYIAGAGRSGSTVLSNVLASLTGWPSVGEVKLLWERGLGKGWSCGCGDPLPDCLFWTAVLDQAVGGADRLDLDTLLAEDRHRHRIRALPRRTIEPVRSTTARSRYYDNVLNSIYRALGTVSRSPVVIDSSKSPLYGVTLTTLPAVSVHVAHLVRDPRAVAAAWQKVRRRPPGEGRAEMLRFSYRTSALTWSALNVLAETTLRRHAADYRRVRYEDVMAHPGKGVSALASVVHPTCDVKNRLRGFDGTTSVSVQHTVAGNPNRLHTGSVTLRGDHAWQDRITDSDRRLTSLLTAHTTPRYGYPFWGLD